MNQASLATDGGAGRPRPATGWKQWPLVFASMLYSIGARIHRAQARWTRPARGRPACKVLSVGALTIGGAGKTPVAAALSLALHARGYRVVLASRGYRGDTSDGVTVVSDGRFVRSAVRTSGDESLVLAAHAPGVPVIVAADRRVAGHHAVSRFAADVLVLDDGFQHHRLARDLDLVCIDGQAGLGNGRVVPWGPLREPASALRYADWLCIVDGCLEAGGEGEALGDAAEKAIEGMRPGTPILRARRKPRALRSLEGSAVESIDRLRGRSVGMLAGIARPDSLRRTIEALGAHVVAEVVHPDHHAYRESDIQKLPAEVPVWVTTEKDALKILPEWTGGARIWVLEIEVEFESAEEALSRIETALFGSDAAADHP